MDSNMIVRVHILVKGRVQNVGFRAHVEYHAAQIGGITGWVRNVGHDSVEAVAEGERAKVAWEMVTGEFKEFGVKKSS